MVNKEETNNMPFPCFPAPSDKVVELAKQDSIIPALKAYRAEATATLLDGTVVRPTIRLAADVAKCLRLGMPAFAVAVEEGFYTLDETYTVGRDYP
jgi:hypothetical protein